MQQARRVEVDLEVSSWVEGRGVRHTDWSVRVNDSWVAIKELRNVIATMAEPELSFADEVDELKVVPPGCQYRITFHPSLPVGTRVQRRISTPLLLDKGVRHAPEDAAAAFRALMTAGLRQNLPLKTTFTEYRVTTHGLVTEARWQRLQGREGGRAQTVAAASRAARSTAETVARAEIEAFARGLLKVG